MPELTAFDRVKSMIRYLPPNGTAGFARTDDRIDRRSPSPPGRIPAMTGFGTASLRSFGCREAGYREVGLAADASTGGLPPRCRNAPSVSRVVSRTGPPAASAISHV